MSFLKIADTTTNPETRQRNRENARKAYEAVRRFLPRVALTDAEAKALHQNLELLRSRLEAIGELFQEGG